VIVAASPCLAKKAKDESPESVLFWVSPDGDVFVQETRRMSGLFARRKRSTTGVLLRLRWPPTVIFKDLPEEPVLSDPNGSVHFIGGERLLAVTEQKAGEDDFRVLFWDGIDGTWRLLAPMATLDPVRSICRTTIGPKRWFALSAPDDGFRVCGFLLDDYLSDVKKKLCINCPEARMPRGVIQNADGNLACIVMTPSKGAASTKVVDLAKPKEKAPAEVEVAVFDMTSTDRSIESQGRKTFVLGPKEPSHIVALGDTFLCGFEGKTSYRILGFKLAGGKVERLKTEFEAPRLSGSVKVILSPSIHNDGFMLVDCDGKTAVVRKLSASLAEVGKWTLSIPKEVELPIEHLVFNEKMGFLHISDSKGKIVVCTVPGSSDVLWPLKVKAQR